MNSRTVALTELVPGHQADRPVRYDAAVRLIGIGGFAIGLGYALFVRFYQATGGRVGLAGFGRPPGFSWASYTAGLQIMVGAIACLVLTQPSLREVPAWLPTTRRVRAPRWLVITLCAVPTMIGSVAAVSHGAGGELSMAFEAVGWGTASIHAGDRPMPPAELRWELAFYEPWFLAFGVCMGIAAIGYLRQTTTHTAGPRAAAIALTGVCILASTIVTLAMMLHWPLDLTGLFTH